MPQIMYQRCLRACLSHLLLFLISVVQPINHHNQLQLLSWPLLPQATSWVCKLCLFASGIARRYSSSISKLKKCKNAVSTWNCSSSTISNMFRLLHRDSSPSVVVISKRLKLNHLLLALKSLTMVHVSMIAFPKIPLRAHAMVTQFAV